jgi:hypothetical protein
MGKPSDASKATPSPSLGFSTIEGGIVQVELIDGEVPEFTPTTPMRSLHDSFEPISAALQAITASIVETTLRPDELDLQFAVKISAESGAIISKDPNDGQFRITARYRASPTS